MRVITNLVDEDFGKVKLEKANRSAGVLCCDPGFC